jgi:hypothetical protein
MKIKVVKEHINYDFGEHEVTEERGNYLVAMGIAEKVETGHESKKEIVATTEKVEVKQPRKKKGRPKKEKNEL